MLNNKNKEEALIAALIASSVLNKQSTVDTSSSANTEVKSLWKANRPN
jgi:hypothetical protein